MKTYQLSKTDLDYLAPVHANMQALNAAINVYIINVVYPRLSIEAKTPSRYDVTKGELYVYEEKDLKQGETPAPTPAQPQSAKPEAQAKPTEKPEEKKAN